MKDDNTLQEAKQYLRKHWKQGVSCPCCGQLVKLYKFKLNSAAALSLISLYKQSSAWGEDVHVSKISHVSSSGGNFAQLAHWRLIEAVINTDTQKRTSGKWRITDKGITFVTHQLRVPAYMLRFDGKCLGFSEQMISIKEALGAKFDYAELMGELYQEQKQEVLL